MCLFYFKTPTLWTVSNKIKKITKGNGTIINYTYDAGGNRISKIVTTASTGDSTYYVRDASGNVMSVYNKKGTLPLTQTEIHLYGSSRLAVNNSAVDVQNCSSLSSSITNFTRGNKFFELSNHLQNVLVTISDKKIGVDANSDGMIDYYTADVITANDYAPFGALLPGRKYSQANTKYRYGFNGKENDNEVKGEGNQQDYGMRIYDPRLGRFLSVDPITKKYPMLTPYQFASNRPIDGVDQDGLEYIKPIPTFEYNGTIESNPVENVPSAAVNGVIQLINIAPALWNSAVKNIEAVHNGTWQAGISKEVKQTITNTSAAVGNFVDGFNTPIKQQAINFVNVLNNPKTLETGVSFATPFVLSAGLKYTGTLLKVEASVPDKLRAANFGNQVHYDPLNGKASLAPALPTELSAQYPETEFSFTRRGAAGADVQVTGGIHPSAYPGATRDPRNIFGDFKPGNTNGAKTFKAEIKSGKLPANTQMLPYDTKTGKLKK